PKKRHNATTMSDGVFQFSTKVVGCVTSPLHIMNCFVWNCQGLGGPGTVRQLCEMIRTHNPSLVFLIETKSGKRRADSLKNRLNMYEIHVDAIGRSGGLLLLWNKDVRASLLSYSSAHIDILVYQDDCLWQFTGFYGHPDAESLSSSNWLLRDFRAVLADTNLHDLGYVGPKYTWCNNHEYPHTVRCRLDRGLADARWRSLFPSAQVSHLSSTYSDHYPLLVELAPRPQPQHFTHNRPWRFEAFWVKSTECEEIIRESWNTSRASSLNQDLWQNLESCRLGLLTWSKKYFAQHHRRIHFLECQLAELKRGPLSAFAKRQCSVLQSELDCSLRDEETKWRQRAKVAWLCEGDANTRFFHACASSRLKRNTIHRLKDRLVHGKINNMTLN
ncbi:UNVERIFIED_CONTAM: hypothetical protein Slati_1728900, partial [Sesamum latifolium]